MSRVGRPKKGTNQLPEWFDVKKYQVVKNFTARDWAEQVEFRKSILEFHKIEGVRQDFLDQLKTDFIAALKRSPFIDLASQNSGPLSEFSKNEFNGRRGLSNYSIIIKSVRPATNCDVYESYSRFPARWKRELPEVFESPVEKIKSYADEERIRSWTEEMFEFMDHKAPEFFPPLVAVDTRVPDEILVSEFKEYLASRRKESGGNFSKIYTKEVDFKNWYASGALPYIDLLVWEKMAGCPIYMPAFVRALSDIGEKIIGESSITKTVKRHVSALFDGRTLQMLYSQAAREDSGAIKKLGRLRIK